LRSIHNLKKAVIKGTYEPIPAPYSAELIALISKCLQLNPADRPEAR
jgi:pyruvate/oxaloacetate carboxyltransferase